MKNGWITNNSGDKFHYQNDLLHSINDEPALIRKNGWKIWYKNGKKHRTNGPAVIFANGYKQHWINDKYFIEKEFNKQTRRKNGIYSIRNNYRSNNFYL